MRISLDSGVAGDRFASFPAGAFDRAGLERSPLRTVVFCTEKENREMKRLHILLPVAALMAMAGGAQADCREDLAQMRQGIAKDGSQAPLAEGTSATPQASDGQP
ncbi:hypothetical protein CNY89_11815, partial [Amaricoccus sp. HAR-UPW-R2A-40]